MLVHGRGAAQRGVVQSLLELVPVGQVVAGLLLVPHLAHEGLGQRNEVLLLLETALQLAKSAAPKENTRGLLLLGVELPGRQAESSGISDGVFKGRSYVQALLTLD